MLVCKRLEKRLKDVLVCKFNFKIFKLCTIKRVEEKKLMNDKVRNILINLGCLS